MVQGGGEPCDARLAGNWDVWRDVASGSRRDSLWQPRTGPPLSRSRSRSLSHTLSYDFRPEQKEEAIKLLFALLVKWDVHCAAWAALFQGAEVTGDPLGQGPRSVFELFIKGRVCVKWEIELKHKHTHPATKC